MKSPVDTARQAGVGIVLPEQKQRMNLVAYLK